MIFSATSVEHKFVGVVAVCRAFAFCQELRIGLLPEIGMNIRRKQFQVFPVGITDGIPAAVCGKFPQVPERRFQINFSACTVGNQVPQRVTFRFFYLPVVFDDIRIFRF